MGNGRVMEFMWHENTEEVVFAGNRASKKQIEGIREDNEGGLIKISHNDTRVLKMPKQFHHFLC